MKNNCNSNFNRMEKIILKKNNLKLNFIFQSLSQFITLLIPLITTPYLARVLHEEGNGKYSYCLSIITYFILFANLGFETYGQREISKFRDNIEKQNTCFFEIFICKSFSSVISFGLFMVLFFNFNFSLENKKILLMLSIQVVGTIFDVSFYFLGIENFKLIAIRTLILKLVGMIFIFIFVKDENDTWIYALCLSLSTIFANLSLIPMLFKKIQKVKIKDLNLVRHFKPCLLIFLPTLAVTIYSVCDKTMIGLLSTNPNYDNGCYEQAYKINNMALLPYSVLASVIIPRNSYDYQQNNLESFNNHNNFIVQIILFIGLPIIIAFFVLSENISAWFLGDGYDSVPLLLKIMSIRMIVSGFSTLFGSVIFIPIGKEKYPLIATFSAAVVNVILNLILIPKYGAVGAAITTAVSEVIVTLVLGIFIYKYHFVSFRFILKKSIKYIISSFIMLIPIYFLNKYFDYTFFSFCLISICGFVLYIFCLVIFYDDFLISILKKAIIFLKNKREKIFEDGYCIEEREKNNNG